MKILLLFIFLVGCTSYPKNRSYNNDEEQDLGCYARPGGRWGYCDALKGNK